MSRLLLLLSCLALFLSPVVAAEPGASLSNGIPNPPTPEGAWTRQKFAVARTEVAPKIDGDLTDPCWKDATHAVGFYRFGGSAPVREQTEAWLTVDKDNLYIAFHCLDSEPQRIQASETQRGGEIGGDDHVAILLDSQNTRRGISFFGVSAIGTQYQEIEGGTADNITWAGDWKAATKRTEDGWTAEISIPFRLLRYPKHTDSFGIVLRRNLARETNPEVWPYLPPEGRNNMVQFFHDFTGIAPPDYAPKPVFLPYILATGAKDAQSARQGIDIKYPLTTTLTGLVSLFPDFQTVEQDVASINFSYNERFVDDRRPFFAEGRDYLPDTNLFYSRRIETVDEAVKVAGKQGQTSVGALIATTRNPDKQRTSTVLDLRQEIGLFSSVAAAFIADDRKGTPNNRVGNLFGEWGGRVGENRWATWAYRAESWQDGDHKGRNEGIGMRLWGMKQGTPNYRLSYDRLSADFVSDLGILFDPDHVDYSASVSQWNRFDKGALEHYEWDFDIGTADRNDGTFFHKDVNFDSYIQNRRGYGTNLAINAGQRRQERNGETFKDWTVENGLWWNQKSLFTQGGATYTYGKQAGQQYRFLFVTQTFLISKPCSVRLNYNRQNLGDEETDQAIVTATYRLSSTQALSARLVHQSGNSFAQSVGAVKGTNVYFAYSARSRSGADLFILLGDPNRDNTRTQVTVKVTRPY